MCGCPQLRVSFVMPLTRTQTIKYSYQFCQSFIRAVACPPVSLSVCKKYLFMPKWAKQNWLAKQAEYISRSKLEYLLPPCASHKATMIKMSSSTLICHLFASYIYNQMANVWSIPFHSFDMFHFNIPIITCKMTIIFNTKSRAGRMDLMSMNRSCTILYGIYYSGCNI